MAIELELESKVTMIPCTWGSCGAEFPCQLSVEIKLFAIISQRWSVEEHILATSRGKSNKTEPGLLDDLAEHSCLPHGGPQAFGKGSHETAQTLSYVTHCVWAPQSEVI